MSQWSHEHPELVGHPDHDPWMQHESYRKVAPMSEVERDQLRNRRAIGFDAWRSRPESAHFPRPEPGVCRQCSHPVEDHLPEEQGCTHPECSCAQVPEQ